MTASIQSSVTVYSSTTAEVAAGVIPKSVVMAGDKSLAITSAKSFPQWSASPWIISNNDGTILATISNIELTLMEAIDLRNNTNLVIANLNFNQTSNGWQTGTTGISLDLLFNNSTAGLQHEWQFDKQRIISCADKNLYNYYVSTFNTDWYNLTTSATLAVISPISFIRCD